MARHHLERMRDPDPNGITVAKGKVKRPVGKLTSRERFTRNQSVDTFRKHQTDELSEVAASLSQRCCALGGLDSFWCGPYPCDPEHIRDE